MRVWRSPTGAADRVLRLVLPCDPDVAGDRRRIARAAAAFRARHPDGRILAVAQDSDALRGIGFDITSARNVLSYAEFLELWTRAYRLAAKLQAHAGGDLARVVAPFHHAIADFALQMLLVPAMLRVLPGPVLILSLPGTAARCRDLDVEVLPTPWSLRRLRVGDVRVARIARAGRDLAVEGLRRLLPSRDAGRSTMIAVAASTSPAILVVLEDGVSGVNFPSARAIIEELRRAGARVAAVTRDRPVRDALEAIGVPVGFCGVPNARIVGPALLRRWRSATRDLARLRRDPALEWEVRALADLVTDRLLAYSVFGAQVEAVLAGQHSAMRFGAALVINEGTPTAVAALGWLATNRVPDVGYWPALLGARPDCEYFPARHHLVYGDDLRDMMIAMGIDAATIEPVGSINFDQSIGRDGGRDRAYVRDRLLVGRVPRQKLVVVATEALPGPFEEIGPVLDALAAMPAVEIVLKLHPADSPKFYGDYLLQRGLGDRVMLVESCDLDALLHAADLLVCVLSNIIVRAALLDTPTLVCDFGEKRRPLDFVAAGLAFGCFSPLDVDAKLRALLDDGAVRREAIAQLKNKVLRFCHSADGRTAKRVSGYLLARAAAPGAAHP